MFDEILKTVKEHFADNPHLTANVPADQHDALHKEIAEHVNNNLSNSGAAMVPSAAAPPPDATGSLGLAGGLGGVLDKLKDGLASGSPIVTAIEGGLVGSLASKFGLGSAVTGAIAASLPGLLQKFAAKKQATSA